MMLSSDVTCDEIPAQTTEDTEALTSLSSLMSSQDPWKDQMPLNKKVLSKRQTQERQVLWRQPFRKQPFRKQPQTAALFHKVLSSLWSHMQRQPQECFKTQAHVANASDHMESRKYEEALASPVAAEWKLVVSDELTSVQANDTWTMKKKPAIVGPIPVKWVFKIKSMC